jgi:hypothetical protein
MEDVLTVVARVRAMRTHWRTAVHGWSFGIADSKNPEPFKSCCPRSWKTLIAA